MKKERKLRKNSAWLGTQNSLFTSMDSTEISWRKRSSSAPAPSSLSSVLVTTHIFSCSIVEAICRTIETRMLARLLATSRFVTSFLLWSMHGCNFCLLVCVLAVSAIWMKHSLTHSLTRLERFVIAECNNVSHRMKKKRSSSSSQIRKISVRGFS